MPATRTPVAAFTVQALVDGEWVEFTTTDHRGTVTRVINGHERGPSIYPAGTWLRALDTRTGLVVREGRVGGEPVAHVEPAARPFVVCPRCEGHGTTSRLGAFTTADVDEWHGDDAAARDEFVADYRAGHYDEVCGECRGRRVVRDECACRQCQADRDEAAEYAALARAEQRAGC